MIEFLQFEKKKIEEYIYNTFWNGKKKIGWEEIYEL